MAYSLTYSYDATSQSYSVTGYSNITESDKVVIPSTYDDGTNGSYPVTSIEPDAFASCTSLTSITIPGSIEYIGNCAFQSCESLTSVIICNGVQAIEYSAFEDCISLATVSIPDSVTSIGDGVFANCTSLMSIAIGGSVTDIGYAAFRYCDNLKIIALLPEIPPYLGSNDIPQTTTIYVPRLAKEAYKSATNWNSSADKIESNDIYLSLIRFNRKNKEYIKNTIPDIPDTSTFAKTSDLENGAIRVNEALNAEYAQYAYNDVEGNSISDTYAKKSDLQSAEDTLKAYVDSSIEAAITEVLSTEV